MLCAEYDDESIGIRKKVEKGNFFCLCNDDDDDERLDQYYDDDDEYIPT